jgi:RNA polymerase sigma-70 factor (ECF subfamily)
MTALMTARDEDLIQQLADGDEDALAQLIDRHWQRAYTVAYHLTKDADRAEDVAQETFVKLLDAASSFDPERAFRPWFFQILRNQARMALRSSKRRQGHEARAARLDRSGATVSDEAEAVHVGLATLPSKQREPIVLHYLQGLTVLEVAEALGWPKGTVASRIRRGVAAMRDSLQPVHSLGATAIAALLKDLPALEAPDAPLAIELLAERGGAPEAPEAPEAAQIERRARGQQPALAGRAARRGGPLLAAALVATVGALLLGTAFLADDPLGAPPVAQATGSPHPASPPTSPSGTASLPAPGTQPPTPAESPAASPAPSALPETSPEPTDARPTPPRTWAWGETEAVSELPKRTLPIGTAWVDGALYLATFTRSLSAPTVQLFRRADARWEAVGEPIPGDCGRYTHLVAVGPDLGVLGTGGLLQGGSLLGFLRVSTRGELLMNHSLIPNADGAGRHTISAVVAEEGRLTVSVLAEPGLVMVEDGDGGATGVQVGAKQLRFFRSQDGGRTWGEAAPLETSMKEDLCRVGGFAWSERDLGQFECGKRETHFVRSSDGGLSWQREAVELRDDLAAADGGRRLPLRGVALPDGGVGLLYLGFVKGGEGYYALARSADQGRTWEPGALVATLPRIDDPSLNISVAAAGELVAATYVEVLEKTRTGRQARQRVAVSRDAGATWELLPADEVDLAWGTAQLTAAPAGGRLILTGVQKHDDGPRVVARVLSR